MLKAPLEVAEIQDSDPEEVPEVEGTDVSQCCEAEGRDPSLRSGGNSSSDAIAENYFWSPN